MTFSFSSSSSFILAAATLLLALATTTLFVVNAQSTVDITKALSTEAGHIAGYWEPIETFPLAAYGAAVTCGTVNGTNMSIVIGGIDSDFLATHESFTYNFSSETWDRLRSSGLPPTSHARVGLMTSPYSSWDQRLLFIGGYSLETGFNQDAFFYSVETETWNEITTSDAPSARRGAGSWSYGSTMVIFGGATENNFDNNVYILKNFFSNFPFWEQHFFNGDAGGTTSTSFGTAPTPRFGQCCVHVNITNQAHGYCFGGTTETGDSNEMWDFNEAAVTWTLSSAGASNKPAARRDMSCAYFEDTHRIAIYGGYSSTVGGTMLDNKTYIFDIGTDAWVTPVVQNTSGGEVAYISQNPGCSINSQFISAGGYNQDGDVEGSAMLASSTDYKFKRIAPTISSTPAGRYFHNSISIGDDVFILFGADDLQAYNDLWKYDTLTSTWEKLGLTPSDEDNAQALPARFGASIINIGRTLYVFGGASYPILAAVQDLVVIELTTLEYRILSQSKGTGSTGAQPSSVVRMNHVMFRFGNDLIVGSGVSTSLTFARNWYVFNIQTQAWNQLSVTNEVKFRYGMSAVQMNDTHALVGLGYGLQSYFNWFWAEMNGTKLVFTQQVPQLNYDSDRRRVIRMFASAILAGTAHLFICGGQTDPETPPAVATRCYHYNLETNKIYPVHDLEVPVSGHTAVHVRSKMYVFGGRKMTSAQLLDSYANEIQIFQINTSYHCAAAATNETECVKCGPGMLNPNCVPVEAGKYVSGSTQAKASCPAGTFLPFTGASDGSFCLKCPAGKFQSSQGQSSCNNCTDGFICPMGSTSPLGLASGYGAYLQLLGTSTNLTLTESNPAPYSAPSPPWFPVLLVAVTALVLALALAIFVSVNAYVWKARFKYFIPSEKQELFEKLYEEYSRHIAGMSESNFIEVCHVEEFPSHEAHVIELQQLFYKLDVNGSNALLMDDFLKAVIHLIEDGKMKPLEGSTAAKENSLKFETWVPDKIRDMQMSNFDIFSDSHRSGEPGDDVRNMQTYAGGVLSLGYYMLIIILILAIIVNFAYSNIIETKAAVPRAVIQSTFGKDRTVAEPSMFRVRIAVVGPLHGKTLTQLKEVCIANNTQGRCNSHTSATISGLTAFDHRTGKTSTSHSNPELNCHFNSHTEECEIEYICHHCYVPSKATLLFEPSAFHSGDAIRVRVLSTTGIRDPIVAWNGRLELTGGKEEESWVERRITPSDNSTVFTGSPPTTFSFGVTPTFVEANEVIHNVNPTADLYLASGYHVRPNGNPSEGNAVQYDAFDRFHGCPVQVEVVTDVTPLFVRRVFIQSSVQLIVSLLGAVSGLGGGIVAAVNIADGMFAVNENSQRARDDELKEKEGVAAVYARLPKVAAEDVPDALYLIKNGFRANVAKELIDIMEENHQDPAFIAQCQKQQLAHDNPSYFAQQQIMDPNNNNNTQQQPNASSAASAAAGGSEGGLAPSSSSGNYVHPSMQPVPYAQQQQMMQEIWAAQEKEEKEREREREEKIAQAEGSGSKQQPEESNNSPKQQAENNNNNNDDDEEEMKKVEESSSSTNAPDGDEEEKKVEEKNEKKKKEDEKEEEEEKEEEKKEDEAPKLVEDEKVDESV